jgi:polar amino acid transport system substrate-binding protein
MGKVLHAATMAIISLCMVHAAGATTLQLATANMPPYSMETGDKPGFIRELIAEIAKLVKVDLITSLRPIAEAHEFARNGENVLVFPLARTPAREANYTWVVKLFDTEGAFMTPPGKPAVSGLDDAKGRKVGALKGTPFAAFLRNQGFTNVTEMATSREMVDLLASGGIDAWLSDSVESSASWTALGQPGRLAKGYRAFIAPLWLGASLKSPDVDAAAWQDALQVLQQDGTFDRIYQSYGLK